LSFFDEDDEPRTRVRPRRAAPAGGAAPPDRQTLLLRQVALFGGVIVVLVLLVLLVNGCRERSRENALRDYNQEVAALIAASDSDVSKPFFDLMRNPTQAAGDLQTQINGYKGQAEQQYEQAKRIDTPDDMVAAQRSFLVAMEFRRDGLQQIADRVRTALSSDAEAADRAINEIAGAMQLFLSSDVVYKERVEPLIRDGLRKADVGGQRLQQTAFLPGIEWLQPATVADSLGQQLAAGDGGARGEPAPGLHGTGIDSVQVGDQTLQPGTANRIPYGPDTEFTVNFTNQGEHDEVDIRVVMRIEGGARPITVQRTVASVAAGQAATATLGLDQRPPLATPVTIRVEVRPVPGEEKKDNNRAEYDGAFVQE
jgi:hypothetical protein